MTTPTPEQLTNWQSALQVLKMWNQSSVSLLNQSHHQAISEMCTHANTEQINYGCNGCVSAGLNTLARLYKDYL